MTKIITKTQDCSSVECINRHVEKDVKGAVCANCITELKKFVEKA